MTELRDATTDDRYFPLISDVRIRFHFPYEVQDASLVSSYPNFGLQKANASTPLAGALGSQPQENGIFNFDKDRRQGEWQMDPSQIMENDEDRRCERALLRGSLTASSIPNSTAIGQDKQSQNTLNTGLSTKIIADVTLSIKKYTFSGARIDRVAINQGAGPSSSNSIRNFKDDDSITRQIRTMSVAQSV